MLVDKKDLNNIYFPPTIYNLQYTIFSKIQPLITHLAGMKFFMKGKFLE